MARKIRCICIRDCYIRHESEIFRHYLRGEVADFTKVPLHFEPIEEAFNPKADPADPSKQQFNPQGGQFDFSTATEELLLAADYDLTDLCTYANVHYGVDIPVDANKAVMVAKFVDARYRFVTADAAKRQAASDQQTSKKK